MIGQTRHNGETLHTWPQKTEMAYGYPWNEVQRIRSDMDNWFSGFSGTAPRWNEGAPSGFRTFTPTVDLYETSEEFVWNAYLPGMSREDFHLEVVGDILHIWGERKPFIPENVLSVHLTQGCYGQFNVRYPLPVAVRAQECTAIYHNGVLEVHLPKVESAKLQPVEIGIDG